MLKDKIEMTEIVKQFVADTALIREDHPLCCMRRDNTGENVSQALEAWLRDKGIRSEKSIRMNRGKMARLRITLRFCAI